MVLILGEGFVMEWSSGLVGAVLAVVAAVSAWVGARRGDSRADFQAITDTLQAEFVRLNQRVVDLQRDHDKLHEERDSLIGKIAAMQTQMQMRDMYLRRLQTALQSEGLTVPEAPEGLIF